MGGTGSGGARRGSGRRKKSAALTWLHGDTGHRPTSTPPVAPAPVVVVQSVSEPGGLPDEQAQIWRELSQHALVNLTLTPETEHAFRDLCEAIVLKRLMLKKIEDDGLTYIKVMVDGTGAEHQELKAHPLITKFTALMVRCEAGFQRFRLAPDGKPRLDGAAPAPKSALQELQAQAATMRRPVGL